MIAKLVTCSICCFGLHPLKHHNELASLQRKIHLTDDDYPQGSFKKIRTDFVDFAIKPVSADQVLHGLLNIEQCEKVMKMSKL